jgi:hypothetical protein
VLSISYHEFLKVIEPFLQHEPVLSREMSDHLLDVKEIILMSSIWESSSEVCAISASCTGGCFQYKSQGTELKPCI